MHQNNQRMLSQDIAKGIAILIVSILHILEVPQIVRVIVGVLFGYAMPFFLFMSGYNYKNKGLSKWENIKRRTFQIARPFYLYTFIIAIIMTIHFIIFKHGTLVDCIQSYIGFLLTKWGTPYIGWDLPKILFQRVYGPLWFIQFLIPSNVIFYLCVDNALKSFKNLIITVLSLSTISVILIQLGLSLPWGLQDIFAIAAIMIVGAYVQKQNQIFNPNNKTKWVVINCILCFLTIATIELLYNSAGYFTAGNISGVIGSVEVYLTVFIAFIGSYLIINISRLIEKVSFLAKPLIWFGQHSLYILIIHLPLSYIINDILGYEQIVTEFPMAVEHISIHQLITLLITIILLYFICNGIDFINNEKKKHIKNGN